MGSKPTQAGVTPALPASPSLTGHAVPAAVGPQGAVKRTGMRTWFWRDPSSIDCV